MDGKNTFF